MAGIPIEANREYDFKLNVGYTVAWRVTAACQVARSTTGGRPGSAVVGSFGVVVMVSSVVSRAGQYRATSYDGHQNRRVTRPELIAAGAPSAEPGTDHVGLTSSQTRSQSGRNPARSDRPCHERLLKACSIRSGAWAGWPALSGDVVADGGVGDFGVVVVVVDEPFPDVRDSGGGVGADHLVDVVA